MTQSAYDRALAYAEEDTAKLAQAMPDTESQFVKGVRSGTYGMGASLRNAVGAIGDAFGANEFAAGQYQEADRLAQRAGENGPRITSYKDVGGLRDAYDYGMGVVGQTVPSAAVGILPGLGQASMAGRLGAATLAYTPLEMGDTVAKMRESNPNQPLSSTDTLRAAGTGLLSAGAQSIVPAAVSGKIMGRPMGSVFSKPTSMTMRQAVARNAWEAPMEGATEAISTGIKQAGAGQEFDLEEIKESAVAGTVGGTVFAGAGAASDYVHGNFNGVKKKAGEVVAPSAKVLERGWDAMRDTGAGFLKGLSESDVGASISERAANTKARIEALLADPETPADIRAKAEKIGKSVGDRSTQMWAAGAAMVRDHNAKRKAEKARKEFEKEARRVVDAISTGGFVGETSSLASATPEQAAAMVQASDQKSAEMAGRMAEDLASDPTMSEETRRQAQEAASSSADPQKRAWVAAKWKAADSWRRLTSFAGELSDALKRGYENGKNQGTKRSADYSGADELIRDALRPYAGKILSDFENDAEGFDRLVGSIRDYMETLTDPESSPSDPQREFAREGVIKHMGPEGISMLGDILASIGKTGSRDARAVGRAFEELSAAQRVATGRKSFVRAAAEWMDPANPVPLATLEEEITAAINWARGKQTKGLSKAQAAFVDTEARRLIEARFGSKTNRFMAALGKVAIKEGEERIGIEREEEVPEGDEGTVDANSAKYDDGLTESEIEPDIEYRGKGKQRNVLVENPDVARARRPGYESDTEALMKRLQTETGGSVRFVSLTEKPELLDTIPDEKGRVTKFANSLPADMDPQDREKAVGEFRAKRAAALKEEGKGLLEISRTRNRTRLSDNDIDSVRNKEGTRNDSVFPVGNVDEDGNPKPAEASIDAVKLTKLMIKKINAEREWTEGDDISDITRAGRAFADGITSLMQRYGRFKVDGETIIAYVAGKPITAREALKFDKRTDSDLADDKDRKELAAIERNMEALRKNLDTALREKRMGDVARFSEQLKKLAEQAAPLKGRRDNAIGSDPRMEGDGTEDKLAEQGRQEGDPFNDNISFAASVLDEGSLEVRTNVDGTTKKANSYVPKATLDQAKAVIVLAEEIRETGGVAEGIANRMVTMARNITVMSEADQRKFFTVLKKPEQGKTLPSQVSEIIAPLANKYRGAFAQAKASYNPESKVNSGTPVRPSGADAAPRAQSTENGVYGELAMSDKALNDRIAKLESSQAEMQAGLRAADADLETVRKLDPKAAPTNKKWFGDNPELTALRREKARREGTPDPKVAAADKAALQQATSTGDAATILTALVERFAPGMNIAIVDGEPRGNGNVRRLPDGSFEVRLKAGMTPEKMAAVLAHEFGHALQMHSFDAAPQMVKNEIMAAYEADVAAVKADGASRAEYVKRFGHIANVKAAEGFPDGSAAETIAARDAAAGQEGYSLSFEEWFANQVSKYATSTDFAGMSPEVQSFWKRVVQTLREAFQALTKEMRPAKSFSEWMNQLAKQAELRVTEKQASLIRNAIDGKKQLMNDIDAVNDPKMLTRVTELLSNFAGQGKVDAVLEKANARIAELVKDPNMAYGMKTRKYSLERVGKPDVLYHGTRAGESALIDANGNLVLKPSKNFGGKTHGVSFTDDLGSARDYAIRIKGGGPKGFTYKGAKIITIDRSALSNVQAEAMREWADYTGADVVIPKGKFRIEPVSRDRHFFVDSHLADGFREWFNDAYSYWEREEIYQMDDWEGDYQARYLEEIVDQESDYSPEDVAEAKAILRDQYGRKEFGREGETRKYSMEATRAAGPFALKNYGSGIASETWGRVGPVEDGWIDVFRDEDGNIRLTLSDFSSPSKDGHVLALDLYKNEKGEWEVGVDGPERGSRAAEKFAELFDFIEVPDPYNTKDAATLEYAKFRTGVFSPTEIKSLFRALRDGAAQLGVKPDKIVKGRDTGNSAGKPYTELSAAGYRRFSQEQTDPIDGIAGNAMPMGAKEALDYIKKVLGDSVQVEFANILHAGDFTSTEVADIIRLSVHSLNPKTVAYHESLHAFFQQLRDKGANDVVAAVFKGMNSPFVVKQLRERLAHSPEALEQLKDPEERAAYAFQFYMSDKSFRLTPDAKGVFAKIAKAFRKILGLWTNDERALQIFEYFGSGQYQNEGRSARRTQAAVMRTSQKSAVETAIRLTKPLMNLGNAVAGAGGERLRDTGVPALIKLADTIKRKGTKTGRDGGYLPASRMLRTTLLNRLAEWVKDYDQKDLDEALEAMQSGEKPKSTKAKIVQRIVQQKFLRETMFDDYFVGAGLSIKDLGPDYFPRVWDPVYISKNQESFIKMLREYGISNPESTMNKIIAGDGNQFEVDKPGFASENERKLTMIPDNVATEFVKKNFWEIMDSYVTQATRRGEWARRFGEDNKGYEELLALAKEQGATPEQLALAEKYTKAVNGTLGDDIDPDFRRIQGNVIVYQNIRLLPLAIFSSVVDPLGIMVRGGTMGDAWSAFARGVKNVHKTFQKNPEFDAATKFAEDVGVIENAILQHSISSLYGQGMMGDAARKVNDLFFRYNLMEGWNRDIRVGAAVAASKFILRHAQNPGKHSARYLAELGLTPEDVVEGPNGLEVTPKIKQAINRWVDGAVLRPDAADMAIWMNDPHFALIAHLKRFTFAFHQTFLKRMWHEHKEGNYAPAMALIGFVPVMLAADMVKDLATGFGDEPEWKRGWGAEDHLAYAVQRAGLLGMGQFGVDGITQGPGSLGGPTVDQLADAIDVLGGNRQFNDFLLRSMPANSMYRELFDTTAEPVADEATA